MSLAMSATELIVMIIAISASLAVMVSLVFVAEHQSNKQRPRSGERRAIRPPAGNRRSVPARESRHQGADRPERQPAVPQPSPEEAAAVGSGLLH